jgi:ankyrin repeat protein
MHNGSKPLHKAAKNGHYEVCQLVISNVNEKNPASNDGFTPLHIATKHGHYKICNLIKKN